MSTEVIGELVMNQLQTVDDVDDIGIEGNKFGFKVPGNCSLYVDYVKIASSDTSNTRKFIPSVSSIKQASEINTTKWVK